MTLDDCINAAHQPDALNPLFAKLHARSKDSPAKTWWHAEAMHPAIFRALRMDRAETGAIYAAAAFRLHRDPDGARILAAFPAPRILAPHDNDDWLDIEAVLSWNPVDDTAVVVGDAEPQLIGRHDTGQEAAHIYASPFAFLRAFAESRAQWFVLWAIQHGHWKRRPVEPDLTPGFLLLGDPDEVRWPVHAMPRDLFCHGVDPKTVNRSILRQARLPRASSSPTDIRSAA